jgi:Cytidylate kinase-like family
VTHVVKVRVRTTMALRVRRIMACMDTDESDLALAKILLSDQRQADTLNRLFRIKDSESNELYDLVVDTGREPAENCAMHIVGLASRKANAAAGSSMINLDTMAAQVRALRIGLTQNEAGELAKATSARRQSLDQGGLKLAALPCTSATQLFV